MNQSWGYYELSNLYISPQNWVSKLVILLKFMATNISRSTCLKSLGSCTVWKLCKKLVHSVTLQCSHIKSFFMLFMTSQTWSWKARYIHLICLFCSRWYGRLSSKSFYDPICGLSALVFILNLFLVIYMSGMIVSPLLSSLLVFFHQAYIYMGSDLFF